jgi:hypothetical protein
MRAVDDTLQGLLGISIVIALGFLVAVAFYESLCTRDVLVGRAMRFTRRRTARRPVLAVMYGLTVFVGIPVLVVVWTQVLELSLVFVGSAERLGNLALISASIVAATRILAYVREKTAHELAKAIPLSLAFILITGGVTHLEDNLLLLSTRQDLFTLTTEMMLFLIALEIGLRLLTDGSHQLLAFVRRRRGIEADMGIWRTLWAGVRRPLASVVPGQPLHAPAPDPADGGPAGL